MNTRTQQILSLIVAVAGAIMACDAQIKALGFIDPRISVYWPLVLAFSTVISRIAAIIADTLAKQDKKIPLLLLAALLPLGLMGCATDTDNAARNARNAGLNAAGREALRRAERTLGTAAVQALFSVAQSEASGAKVDWMQSAATGLWSQANSATTSDAVFSIVSAFSAGKAQQTAATASKAAHLPLVFEEDPAKVAGAIAAVISTAAGAPPAK